MSFLPFSWISKSDHCDEDPSSPLPPVLTASQSHDTLSDGEDYIRVARRHFPSTPEGLRPRRPSSFIRRDLGVLVDERQPKRWGVLPQRAIGSWPSHDILSSPPASKSGVVSRSIDQHEIAESPNLLPGRAKTAVGALVALQQQLNQPAQEYETVNLGYWPRPLDTGSRYYDDSYDFENDEPQYIELSEDPIHAKRSPIRNSRRSEMLLESPISANSSNLGSPSSRKLFYRPMEYMTTEQNKDVSFSSQAILMTRSIGSTRYDFGPLICSESQRHVSEVVLSTSSHANISAMSQSAVNIQDSICGDTTCSKPNDKYLPIQEDATTDFQQLDGALRTFKKHNQRRAKEELLLSAVTRLRDDLKPVILMQEINKSAVGMEEWLINTPVDREGLLTGFANGTRTRILSRLSTILNDIDLACEHDNSSVFSLNSDTCSDLRASLVFCRNLVQYAVPNSEKAKAVGESRGKWIFPEELRNSLGVIPAESPQAVRGGDTSLFSLPSDPAGASQASVVSLTTTITSVVTPFAPSSDFNGVKIRRTIEILTSLVQKMTLLCSELAGNGQDINKIRAQDTIQLTERIRRTYSQLLAMENVDLKAFVSCFRFELKRDGAESRRANSFLLPPAPPILQPSGFFQPQVPNDIQDHNGHQNDLFSPNTDDMRTHVVESKDDRVEEYDDLRRQFGSTDYDEELEIRDGPAS